MAPSDLFRRSRSLTLALDYRADALQPRRETRVFTWSHLEVGVKGPLPKIRKVGQKFTNVCTKA